MNKKQEKFWLLVLVAVAIIIRLLFPSAETLAPDSTLYLKLADKIAVGQLELDEVFTPSNIIQPGFSIVIFLINQMFRNPEFVGVLISILSGVVLIVLIFYLGKRLFNVWTGLIAGIVIAIHPLFIRYSTIVLTESLFTALFIGAILMFWSMMREPKSHLWYFFLGLLVGYAYLVRIVGLSLVLVFLFWIVANWSQHNKLPVRKIVLSIVVFIIGVSMLVAPYLFYLYEKTGQFVLTGQQAIAANVQAEFDQYAADRMTEKRRVFQSLTEDKTDYAINYGGNSMPGTATSIIDRVWSFGRLFIINISYNAYFFVTVFLLQIIILIYGLYRAIKKKENTLQYWYLLSIIPLYLFIYYLGQPSFRYYYPIVVLLLLLASAGAVQLIKGISKINIRMLVISILITIFVLYEVVVHISFLKGENIFLRPFFRPSYDSEMTLWIDNNLGSNLEILSTTPVVSYEVDARNYGMPYADIDSIIYFARYHNLDYIFVQNWGEYYGMVKTQLDDISTNPDSNIISIIKKPRYSLYRLEY